MKGRAVFNASLRDLLPCAALAHICGTHVNVSSCGLHCKVPARHRTQVRSAPFCASKYLCMAALRIPRSDCTVEGSAPFCSRDTANAVLRSSGDTGCLIPAARACFLTSFQTACLVIIFPLLPGNRRSEGLSISLRTSYRYFIRLSRVFFPKGTILGSLTVE